MSPKICPPRFLADRPLGSTDITDICGPNMDRTWTKSRGAGSSLQEASYITFKLIKNNHGYAP